MKKPEDLSWERFRNILNKEFKTKQDTKIANAASAVRQRRAWDMASQRLLNLQKEKDLEKQREIDEANRLKQKEEDERKRKEAEERERKRKEEERRKEEEKQKEKEKQERERKEREERAAKEAEEYAKNLIPSFLKVEEEGLDELNISAFSSKNGNGLDFDFICNLQEKTIDINQKNFNMASNLEGKLKKVSELLNDPDVILALENLKCIGSDMRKRNLVPGDGKPVQRMLDMGVGSAHVGENNSDGCVNNTPVQVKVEKQDMAPIRSPPSKVFSGHKRHTSETFHVGISSAKKKKTGNTPSRCQVGGSPTGTPVRPSTNFEECLVQADSKSKIAESGNLFLKKKKITPANADVVYQCVTEKERDIIEYPSSALTFFKIMAHYTPEMAFVPEDERPYKLKTQLVNFVMKNIDYTKVSFQYSFLIFHAVNWL